MASVTFEKLQQSLQEKKFAPVYFLHGTEPFFIDQISDYIEKNALTEAEKGFNQVVLYGRDVDVYTIINACSRYPMMASHQVVIVKEAQLLKNFDALESYLNKPVQSTILVLCHKYKTLDKRLKINKVLDKNAVVFESKPLAENKVADWVKNYLQSKGLKITNPAAQMMADFVGSDLEKLSNGLYKMAIAAEKGATITEKDIEANVAESKEYKVWELQSALATRNTVKTTKLVNYLAQTKKENPLPMIVGLLYGFFSKATALYLSAKPNEAKAELGINAWSGKDIDAAVKTFGSALPKIMNILQTYDLRFKGVDDTGTDETELTKEMIYKILYIK
ncbi:MAG: DNA polymerase III subunit delta [Bacteroidia bacterium]